MVSSVFERLANMTPEEREQSRLETEAAAKAKAKAAAEFWDKNEKGHTLLPDVYRDDIVQSGAVVMIHAIRDGETKFGPTWFSDIEYSGELWTMPQSHNQLRDRFMLNAIDYIAAFGPLPATIEEFQAKGGDGYDFGKPPAEWLQALASGTGEIGAGEPDF